MSSQAFEPDGTRFRDGMSGREMLIVEGGSFDGWLCYRHPDGQWVTLRKATAQDRAAVSARAALDESQGP